MIMTLTNKAKARQRRAAAVEYAAFAFDERGLFIDQVRFLSTPVLHVNGPGPLRFKCINNRFTKDFDSAIISELGFFPWEATIFRVDGDGTLHAVLRWTPEEKPGPWPLWKCLKHEDCWLTERHYGW